MNFVDRFRRNRSAAGQGATAQEHSKPKGFQAALLDWLEAQPDSVEPHILDHSMRSTLAKIYNTTPDRSQADAQASVLLDKAFPDREAALQWRRHQYLLDLRKHASAISQSVHVQTHHILHGFHIEFQPKFRMQLAQRDLDEVALRTALSETGDLEAKKGLAAMLLGDAEIANLYVQYQSGLKALEALTLHHLGKHAPRAGNYEEVADLEGRRLENAAITVLAPLTREGEHTLRLKIRDAEKRLVKDVLELTGESQLGVQ